MAPFTMSRRNTLTLTAKLMNDLHKIDRYVALLDVAKACPLVPQMMIDGMIQEAGALEPIAELLTETYSRTHAVLHLHDRDLRIQPKRGMKEGCPLSPILFLLFYDVLLRGTVSKQADAQLYVLVDDIAGRPTSPTALFDTLNHVHHVAYCMGLLFIADKTETYH